MPRGERAAFLTLTQVGDLKFSIFYNFMVGDDNFMVGDVRWSD